jgi:hypothetical protein
LVCFVGGAERRKIRKEAACLWVALRLAFAGHVASSVRPDQLRYGFEDGSYLELPDLKERTIHSGGDRLDTSTLSGCAAGEPTAKVTPFPTPHSEANGEGARQRHLGNLTVPGAGIDIGSQDLNG